MVDRPCRELLITSHVIELRSHAERLRRGCAMRSRRSLDRSGSCQWATSP